MTQRPLLQTMSTDVDATLASMKIGRRWSLRCPTCFWPLEPYGVGGVCCNPRCLGSVIVTLPRHTYRLLLRVWEGVEMEQRLAKGQKDE